MPLKELIGRIPSGKSSGKGRHAVALTAAVVPSPGKDHGDGVAHIGDILTAFVHQQLVARSVFSRSHEDGL